MGSFRRIKPFVISLLGNVFEWYDFMIYAALAPIIATVFFPAQNGVNALLATYGVFAIGFLSRPFGALAFGFLGDRFGRRYALLLAISLMTVPTLLIGCLPSYASIGILAPCLLLLLRLIQGLALSGEMPGCILFLSEMAPKRSQTMVASLAIVASLIGLLLATHGVWWLNAHFGTQALHAGLWRLPFLIAALLGAIIYYLRRDLPETRAFLTQAQPIKQPIRTCVREHWRPILQGACCYAANGICFYFFMVFSLTYFYQLCHFSFAQALLFAMVLQLSMLVMVPIGGYLADRYGRRHVGLISLTIMLSGVYNGMVFLSQLTHYNMAWIVLGLWLIATCIAFYSATLPATVATLFPIGVRFTGVALLNNLAATFFGGLSPLLITYLISTHHSLIAPVWPLIICTLISLVSFWFLAKPNAHTGPVIATAKRVNHVTGGHPAEG